MNNLGDEIVKRPCAFVIRMHNPLLTQGDILQFVLARAIIVSSMHLQCLNNHEGILIIHCVL